MVNFKSIDEKIMIGYELLMKNKMVNACDVWLDAWKDIKDAIAETQVNSIKELQDKYTWSEFLFNYIQELGFELQNAGISDKTYYRKRIVYYEEMLELSGEEEYHLVENAHRGIADSYYALGEKDKSDELYSAWLEQDPDWGWGYVGWSDCYAEDSSNLLKAEEILNCALSRESLRNRIDVLERTVNLYKKLGKYTEAAILIKEAENLAKFDMAKYKSMPVKSEKIGRNDPCLCGSGKKFKKCCGK